MTGHPYPLDYVNRIVSCNITEGRYRLITVKHEIPGQSVVIPGSLDRPSKLVKSLDCPGQPWTVGNYEKVGEEGKESGEKIHFLGIPAGM